MALNLLLILTVFLAPLLSASSGFGFEQIKVFFFLFITTLSGLVWLHKKPKIKWTLLNKSAILFLITLFITSFVGINPVDSFLGNSPYFQGFILYSYLFLFSLMVSYSRINLKTWAIFLSISSLLVSLIAIDQWVSLNLLGKEIQSYAGRVVSTFGQPNFYSGFILMVVPFSLFLAASGNNPVKWVGIATVSLSILASILSESKAAILILFVYLMVWLIGRLSVGNVKILVFISVILFLAASFSLRYESGLLWKETYQPRENQWLIDNSPEKRTYLWQMSLGFILDRPILGYGLESIDKVFTDFFNSQDFNALNIPFYHSFKNLFVNRTHSYPLDLLMFSGILGLGTWLFLLYQVFKKVKSKVLLSSLIIYLVWVLVQNQSIVHLIFFWFLVGIIDKESQNKLTSK